MDWHEQGQNEGQRKNWVRSVEAPLTSQAVPSEQEMGCVVVGVCIVDTLALWINRNIWFWKQISKHLSSGLKQIHFRAMCNCHWSQSESYLLISISEKRSSYTLQNSKNRPPFRQAKPWLTICAIIYLHHRSVCQQNHYFTNQFQKKRGQKLNATWLSCFPTILLLALEKTGGVTGIKRNIKPNRKHKPDLHATAISGTTNHNKIWKA